MSLPKGLQFKTVKPQGFYQEFRDYFVTPVQTYTNQFNVYDIVRIQFNLQDWYIDPYESYIEAEVRLANETPLALSNSQSTGDIQFLMMDGPTTSLINDFRFEINSKEIERIREYDQVGNLLTDLCMYPESVDQKDYEGYYTIKGKPTIYQPNAQCNYTAIQQPASGTTFALAQALTNVNIFPTSEISQGAGGQNPTLYQSGIPISIPTSGTFNMSNLLPISQAYKTFLSGTTNFNGPADSITGISSGVSIVNPSIGYFINPSSFLGGLTVGNSNFGISDDEDSVAYTAQRGYLQCTDSPKLNQIDGHNIFLTNLPTSKIFNGQFVRDCTPTAIAPYTAPTRQYFQIPLLSGVMGVLIPSERWQLIPSSSLGQVNMEFRFNPNAFFAHANYQPNWVVTKFQLRLRMYRFDAAIMSQLKSQISAGIQLHSNIFSMGPIYNIQANTSITNNWQLNNGIPSIKQLFFWFLANDYETRWHCRKNYKVCQNVTSMQLKIGSTYLPQNPIIGHAGNIIMNQQIQQDNSVYLSELHQAMNLLFDCKRHININKLNFAINDRPYDVDLNKMFGTNFSNATVANIVRQLGYSLWNEMRCRGKAVYAFNLEMDKKNDETMTGMDTTKVRPIELILKNDDGNYFKRQSTMYVMFLSDFIVTFRDGETVTEGAG